MKLAKKKITVKVAGEDISKEVVFIYDESRYTASSAYSTYEKYKKDTAKWEQEYIEEREAFLAKEQEFRDKQSNADIGILTLDAYDPSTHDKLLNENTVQK